MTTGDGESVFVDTSVLVYAAVVSAPYHQHARQSLGQLQERGAELWVSQQVLREYLAVLSRPQTFARPLPIEVLVADIRNFLTRFRVAENGPVIMDRLLTLLLQVSIGGKQVHDANIVATMQAYGVQRLLTANASDFARFGHLITVDPLVSRGAAP
jgi:predicted nucleic acid-binding protein